MKHYLIFIFCFLSFASGGVEASRLLNDAQILFEQGKYKAASDKYEILSSRLPQDQLTHMNAGIAAFYSARMEKALFHFTSVSESNESLRLPALYWLSKVYGKMGKKIAAVTTLGIALQTDNIPQGIYHQLLDLVERFGPWEEEFKKRAEEEEYNEDRLYLALQFYRLAWVLNPKDEYQEKLYDMYLKLGDEEQALRLFNMIKSTTIKMRLRNSLKEYRQEIDNQNFKQRKRWKPKFLEFGFKARYISDSNPHTAVRSTEVEADLSERMVGEVDLGINYSRRFDQINQIRFQYLGDQIKNNVESRFSEYKISLPFRALSKTSEGVVTPSYSDSSYGHFSYQRFYSIDANYTKYFRRYRAMFGLAYRKANASSLKLLHQDGDIYEAEVGLGRTTSRTNMRGIISYRIDNMVDGPGAWSNDMKSLELTISRKTLGWFILHGGYRISEKRFDVVGGLQRKDLLQRFDASVELPFLSLFSLRGFYRYEDNRADGTVGNDFTYDRHQIGLEFSGRYE